MTETNLDFSIVASSYTEAAVVQQKASDRLFQLLRIKEDDSVLDVGCGSGALTSRIRKLCTGRVCGIDLAPGMISEARSHYGNENIEFLTLGAQDLDRHDIGTFSLLFCNSSFHWIHPLARAVKGFHKVLNAGGKIGIQAASMSEYCPNFVRAMDKVKADPRTAKGFKNFVPPWTFLETEEAYVQLFTKAGFRVPYVSMEQVCTRHTVDEAFGIFSAGAAAGYLNQENYKINFDEHYMNAFLSVVKSALAAQADKKGTLELRFNRIYLVAFKV